MSIGSSQVVGRLKRTSIEITAFRPLKHRSRRLSPVIFGICILHWRRVRPWRSEIKIRV